MISSAGLGEFRIRDLNDEINKLLREKKHWEERILELGGPDYEVRRRGGEGAVAFMHILCATGERDGKVERGGGGEGRSGGKTCLYHLGIGPQRTGPKMMDHEGKEVPGNRGYK